MYSLLFKGLATTALVGVSMVALTVNQTNQRAIKQDDPKERVVKIVSISNSPVEVTDVRIGESSITSRKQVMDTRQIGQWTEFKSKTNEEWLRSVAFTLRNVSERPIVALTAELFIDHPGIDLPVSLPLTPSKSLPAFLNKDIEAKPNRELLMPAEEIDYQLAPSALAIWEGALKRFKTSGAPSVIELNILRVQFDRDTSWSGGEIFHRNPNKPSEWVPERRVGKAKNGAGLRKAAHASASAFQGTGGCRNSSNDVLFNCFCPLGDPILCGCQGVDETTGDEFGSYKLVDVYVTCYDWEFNPCNTTLEVGSRRRINRNCVV
jgi:hypothetical protein